MDRGTIDQATSREGIGTGQASPPSIETCSRAGLGDAGLRGSRSASVSDHGRGIVPGRAATFIRHRVSVGPGRRLRRGRRWSQQRHRHGRQSDQCHQACLIYVSPAEAAGVRLARPAATAADAPTRIPRRSRFQVRAFRRRPGSGNRGPSRGLFDDALELGGQLPD